MSQTRKKPTGDGWLFLLQIKDLQEFGVERAMGIEPTAQAWEAWVLPLYDAREGRHCNRDLHCWVAACVMSANGLCLWGRARGGG
jgi:hypothetical protein